MAVNSDEKMGDEAIAPKPDDNMEQDEEETVEENLALDTQEYTLIDKKLDELNSALDFLEQKNDNIHAQLVDLLKSNREIREEIKSGHSSNASGDTK